MSTFDFKEVRFVRGEQAVVPDFLSRPFKGKADEALEDDRAPTDGSGQPVGHLHALTYPHRAHREDRRVDEAGRVRVMLLPRMGSKIGVVPPLSRLPAL